VGERLLALFVIVLKQKVCAIMSFSYSDLLELLLKLGPKLPVVWEEVQKIISAVQTIRGLLVTGQASPTFAAEPITSYDIELESQVLAQFSGAAPGAFGAPDFPRLREVFQFIKAHPELLKLLLTLLAL
jgi:hypothetical protein